MHNDILIDGLVTGTNDKNDSLSQNGDIVPEEVQPQPESEISSNADGEHIDPNLLQKSKLGMTELEKDEMKEEQALVIFKNDGKWHSFPDMLSAESFLESEMDFCYTIEQNGCRYVLKHQEMLFLNHIILRNIQVQKEYAQAWGQFSAMNAEQQGLCIAELILQCRKKGLIEGAIETFKQNGYKFLATDEKRYAAEVMQELIEVLKAVAQMVQNIKLFEEEVELKMKEMQLEYQEWNDEEELKHKQSKEEKNLEFQKLQEERDRVYQKLQSDLEFLGLDVEWWFRRMGLDVEWLFRRTGLTNEDGLELLKRQEEEGRKEQECKEKSETERKLRRMREVMSKQAKEKAEQKERKSQEGRKSDKEEATLGLQKRAEELELKPELEANEPSGIHQNSSDTGIVPHSDNEANDKSEKPPFLSTSYLEIPQSLKAGGAHNKPQPQQLPYQLLPYRMTGADAFGGVTGVVGSSASYVTLAKGVANLSMPKNIGISLVVGAGLGFATRQLIKSIGDSQAKKTQPPQL